MPLWLKIGASWATAVIILVGGLYAVQSHGFGPAVVTAKTSDCPNGYWVKVHAATDGTEQYINLQDATSVVRGQYGDNHIPATLVWYGSETYPIKETPEELLVMAPVRR